MTDYEHSINKSGPQANSDDAESEDEDVDEREERSEAEIKRELRKSTVGRAIIDYARRRQR